MYEHDIVLIHIVFATRLNLGTWNILSISPLVYFEETS